MRKNSLKRIFAALALAAVATSSVAVSASAATEDGAASDDTVVEEGGEEAGAAAGTQADGSFLFPDGTVITADQIAASEVKPVISAPVITFTESEAKALVASGEGVPVAVSVAGAKNKWCASGIHLYFDERLTLSMEDGFVNYEDSDGLGKLNIEVKEEGTTGVFFATSGSADRGGEGEIVIYTFALPEDVKGGDKFALNLQYVDGDLFLNNAKDEAGQIMMAYAFNNLQSGYIEIIPDPTEAPTQAPTEAPTQAPTEAPTQAETEAPTEAETEAPTEAPTQAPTQAPAGDAPATGVAGVGAAVAGLAVAAGAAFVLKKKEN